MRILAIDSSGLVATVAVVEEENEISKTIAEYTINYKKTHSQTLLPMLDEIVKMTDMNLDTIDAIAVAGGPGSFTGLRIGSATAKGLGLALKKPLIHIPTVDGLAYNLCYTDRIICPIMDARRNQVYTGIYQMDGDKLQVLEASDIPLYAAGNACSGNEQTASGTSPNAEFASSAQHVDAQSQSSTRMEPAKKSSISTLTVVFGLLGVLIGALGLLFGVTFPDTLITQFAADPQVLVAIVCAIVGVVLVTIAIVWAIMGAVKKK